MAEKSFLMEKSDELEEKEMNIDSKIKDEIFLETEFSNVESETADDRLFIFANFSFN